MKTQRITKVIRDHHLGTTNVCLKFSANPSNVEIFLWIFSINFDQLMAPDEMSGGFTIHPLETTNICTKFHNNPPNNW